MGIKLRQYTNNAGFAEDFFKVWHFLKRVHEPEYRDGNWLWARWEYMFSHPNLDETSLPHIGVWEDDGTIVALANYEDRLRSAYFSFDHDYAYLMSEMIDYAEEHLSATDSNGAKTLRISINDFDKEFVQVAAAKGYRATEKGEPISVFDIPRPFPAITQHRLSPALRSALVDK